ncbi:MAG: nuclear transport factor 2 family protein [Pseudomonadota bacterium]
MTTDQTPDAKTEIDALCRALSKAHADKDADAIVACYAPDAVIYSLAPPLGERGMDRAGLIDWLATWRGPIRIDAAEEDVTIGDDIAFCTALNRIRGTKTDGHEVDLWFRTTLGFRRQGKDWRITHDHASVPFLMDGSERAALHLKP